MNHVRLLRNIQSTHVHMTIPHCYKNHWQYLQSLVVKKSYRAQPYIASTSSYIVVITNSCDNIIMSEKQCSLFTSVTLCSIMIFV